MAIYTAICFLDNDPGKGGDTNRVSIEATSHEDAAEKAVRASMNAYGQCAALLEKYCEVVLGVALQTSEGVTYPTSVRAASLKLVRVRREAPTNPPLTVSKF